jgi:amidase
MSIRPPTPEEIRELSEELGLDLVNDEVMEYRKLAERMLASYETIEDTAIPNSSPDTRYRDLGSRAENNDPYNAWITRCEVCGTEDGPLSGWEIGIKDNIAVGGVEMTCGSRLFEEYVPATDATVVDRILDNGGKIPGKTNMDNMAFAGDGHTGAFGPVLNPRDDGFVSGGSSGGSAAVVASGEVDAALGTDQGGSVRAPAAWTGIVGYKPTYGLVPYTGCVGIQASIDHVGILAPDVLSTATILSVIAGIDNRIDPRQPREVPSTDYRAAIFEDVQDMRIAVIEEGFDRPGSEMGVNELVKRAIKSLDEHGASTEMVSVPLHEAAQDIHTVSVAEAFLNTVRTNGLAHDQKGWHNPKWAKAFAAARQSRGAEFPPAAKLAMIVGAYTAERYQSTYYAKAMNLRLELFRAYEDILDTYDLITMPTTPMTPIELNSEYDPRDFSSTGTINLSNTCAFNITGHPSVSIPVGTHNDLPVGLMLTGEQFSDAEVLSAAALLENSS